jgi:hypothetical protein
LEQASKLSAHKSGGESWGSMEQNDYLLFNLPLSLQYMSNFVKDWRSFQRRWVYPKVMARWYSPFWDPRTTKSLGFKPSDVQVKHLLALWQWDSGLSTACQVGCASKNKSRKGFGLSMLKASSNMSKVKDCLLGSWYFSMLEDHVMYRSLVVW